MRASADSPLAAISQAFDALGIPGECRTPISPALDGVQAVEAALRGTIEKHTVHLEGVPLRGITRVSQRGAPAWRLDGPEGPIAKLRLASDEDMPLRAMAFLQQAGARGWNHCARLLRRCGRVLLKTWVPGTPFDELSRADREHAIREAGRALADLHAPDPGASPLVCGADRYNTVLRADGTVAFVDLECCTHGPGSMDLAWSEDLLCESECELAMLRDAYIDWAGRPYPPHERQEGRVNYLRWLMVNLRGAAARRPGDVDIMADLERTDRALLALDTSLRSEEGLAKRRREPAGTALSPKNDSVYATATIVMRKWPQSDCMPCCADVPRNEWSS